jgi:hypothetical protein
MHDRNPNPKLERRGRPIPRRVAFNGRIAVQKLNVGISDHVKDTRPSKRPMRWSTVRMALALVDGKVPLLVQEDLAYRDP